MHLPADTTVFYLLKGEIYMRATKKICFVLMPFSKEMNNQWHLALKPAIESAELYPLRADDENAGTNIIMSDVTKGIHAASIIIADISGKNPNVMYELGLAHAAKKPVIILAQDRKDVPFDVNHIRYLEYDSYDLPKLIKDLTDRIKFTLAMNPDDRPDLFPQLKIMTKVVEDELKYLRTKARPIEVLVSPPISDIFFNNVLIGQSPQIIRVNPDASVNTISATAIEFYEAYRDITDEDIQQGVIKIQLESMVNNNRWDKRVPRYLRLRRKNPDNPVLMRAIVKYLFQAGDMEDAQAEAKELLEVAPWWYIAHNTYGFAILKSNPDDAERHFRQAIALNPSYGAGYFNLAYIYTLKREFAQCIEQINLILKDGVVTCPYLLGRGVL